MQKKWLFGRFYNVRRYREQYLETIEENVVGSSTENIDSDIIIESVKGQQLQGKNSWVHIGGTTIVSIFQAIVLYVLVHSRNVADVRGDILWIWIMSRFHLFFID